MMLELLAGALLCALAIGYVLRPVLRRPLLVSREKEPGQAR